jgi:hypothetical protein
MNQSSGLLLVAAVAGVGVLHTIVPDHWVPITLLARQRGWSKTETARVAFRAGAGHVLSTLAIALVVWLAGVAVATRFGYWVDTLASLALVGFGGWIAVAGWRDLHGHGGHAHSHSHEGLDVQGQDKLGDAVHGPELQRIDTESGPIELSIYEHGVPPRFRLTGAAHHHEAHGHQHPNKSKSRTTLLLILGSSPMVEGIPAFFAASKYGVELIILMSVVFGATTIATYVLLSVYSVAGLQRVRLGAFERYGEVLSGAFIALVGLAFWIWPVAFGIAGATPNN